MDFVQGNLWQCGLPYFPVDKVCPGFIELMEQCYALRGLGTLSQFHDAIKSISIIHRVLCIYLTNAITRVLLTRTQSTDKLSEVFHLSPHHWVY